LIRIKATGSKSRYRSNRSRSGRAHLLTLANDKTTAATNHISRVVLPSISPSSTVGQLVASKPSLARVFERLGIDYCCGGKRTLAVACAAKGDTHRAMLAGFAQLESDLHIHVHKENDVLFPRALAMEAQLVA
jgi:hypothetical protein